MSRLAPRVSRCILIDVPEGWTHAFSLVVSDVFARDRGGAVQWMLQILDGIRGIRIERANHANRVFGSGDDLSYY